MKNFEKKLLLLLAFLSVLFYFLQPKKFLTTVSVYPDYAEQLDSGILDIASSFGIGKGLNSSSPIIYAPDIVESFHLREKILLKKYDSLQGATYIEYLKSREWFFNLKRSISKNIFKRNDRELDEELIYSYANNLQDKINVQVERLSGLVTLNISIKAPKDYDITYEFSKEVRDFIIVYLEDFINESTRKKALVKIVYMENRLLDVKNTLSNKEDNLKQFLINNKEIDSPLLQTEFLRYSREVELSNAVYILLTKEIESEKIKTVQNELNFIVTDSSENPKPIKFRLRHIAVFNILIILSYYLFWKRRNDFFSFFSSDK
tara:strand:- start:7193 stop:8149 length:957 start_codon:yes stop_codon:yes gene_type:complete